MQSPVQLKLIAASESGRRAQVPRLVFGSRHGAIMSRHCFLLRVPESFLVTCTQAAPPGSDLQSEAVPLSGRLVTVPGSVNLTLESAVTAADPAEAVRPGGSRTVPGRARAAQAAVLSGSGLYRRRQARHGTESPARCSGLRA